MATLQTLRDQLKDELKIDPNNSIWSNTVLNRAIVQAVRQIQQDGNYDWHFNDNETSMSTVVSQATYALATGFVRLEDGTVKYNQYQLKPADYVWLKGTFTTLAQDGQPVYYYLRGNNLGVYPRPNAIQTLEYTFRKKLTDMSSDTDDSGLPDEFNEALTQFACYLTWNDIEGREDKAIAAINNYNEMIKGLFDQFLGRRQDANFNFSFDVPTYNW